MNVGMIQLSDSAATRVIDERNLNKRFPNFSNRHKDGARDGVRPNTDAVEGFL